MTLAEILADLNARIGSSPEVSNALMTFWVNEGLRVFCDEYDFSWLQKKVIASTVANQSDYALPSDYGRVIELQVDGTSTDPDPYQITSHEFRVLQPTSTHTFSIFGSTMTLNPVPTATGDGNIQLWYVKKPNPLVDDSDSPSDTDMASMPAVYHPALVQYAFSVYNSYDEEQDEAMKIMGSKTNPLPGTFYYFVKLAKDAEAKQKTGQRTKILSKQVFSGYRYPNQSSAFNTVLGN